MTQAFNLSQFANTIEDVTGKAVLTSGQSVTGILPVANGGSGVATVPSNRVMVGSGTSGFSTVGTTTSGGGAVSAGMLLTYQGASSNPTWETPPGIGQNQTWTNTTSSIVNNTTYTNSTGKPIAFAWSGFANVANGTGSIDFYVSSGLILSTASIVVNISGSDQLTSYAMGFGIVPTGATYKFVFVNGITASLISKLS